MGFKGRFLFDEKEKQVEILNEFSFIDSNIEIFRNDKEKFFNDTLFFKYNNKIFLLDGVILNNHELEKEYRLKNWQETFIKIYEEDSFNFLNKLRGSFYGLIYDVEKKKLILFTDQLKSKSIFYSLKNDEFIFSTSLPYMASLNKNENVLDENAAYLLLTFGGTLEERTLFKNIRKLNFATFLEIDLSKEIKKRQYWMFDNTEDLSITEDRAIEEIDRLFRQAIKREYDKDLEYGYKHLVALSAGRDSRMNTWVANEMGYKDNVLNITFSENDQLDEKIPKQIATDLKHEWLFKSLNNGNCMYDIDEIMKKCSGEVSYGTLHGHYMLKNLNFKSHGVLHTGMIGDVVIGVFGDSKKKLELDNIKYYYSNKLLKKVLKMNLFNNVYKNEEVFNYVNRAIHVTNESSILFPNLWVISPFLDIDFLEFCLKIPQDKRKGNKLYDNWILKKYPVAAKYSHNGRKIGEKDVKILGKNISISQVIPRILKKIGFIGREKGMNPFDEWYKNNSKLKNLFDNYYKDNIGKLSKFNELKQDCKYLYEVGNAREKAQVIGLLATLKLYFNKEK